MRSFDLCGLEQNVQLNGVHRVLHEWSEADTSWLVDLHDKNLLSSEPGLVHVSKIGYKHRLLQTSNSASDLPSEAANMRQHACCITPILVHQNDKKCAQSGLAQQVLPLVQQILPVLCGRAQLALSLGSVLQ